MSHNAIEATTKVKPCQITKRKDCNANEEGSLLIKNGMDLGYGFIDSAEQINSDEDLNHSLIPQKDSLDIQSILRTYI